jgi:hypothetical protein
VKENEESFEIFEEGNHQFWVFKKIRGKEPWGFPIPIARNKNQTQKKSQF